MPSFQISLTPYKRTAGRFIALVRRELQKALAEEHASRGLTQSAVAEVLGVNRSVIHRQIVGYENLTLSRVGEIASILGREPIFMLVKPAELSMGNQFIQAMGNLMATGQTASSVLPQFVDGFSGVPQTPMPAAITS